MIDYIVYIHSDENDSYSSNIIRRYNLANIKVIEVIATQEGKPRCKDEFDNGRELVTKNSFFPYMRFRILHKYSYINTMLLSMAKLRNLGILKNKILAFTGEGTLINNLNIFPTDKEFGNLFKKKKAIAIGSIPDILIINGNSLMELPNNETLNLLINKQKKEIFETLFGPNYCGLYDFRRVASGTLDISKKILEAHPIKDYKSLIHVDIIKGVNSLNISKENCNRLIDLINKLDSFRFPSYIKFNEIYKDKNPLVSSC